MSELKVSVSGIRGIWADSLTLESLSDYTKAFGAYLRKRGGKKVLLGRDARPTGKAITLYVSGILNSLGFDVLDCGIVPTPTVLFGVRLMGCDGGFIITASHNPIEWNALKFIKRGGTFTGEADVEEIKGFLGKKTEEAAYDKMGNYRLDDSVSCAHMDSVVSKIDAAAIRARKFNVVLDPVNSAGSLITQKLLEGLGCQTVVINGEINGRFDRGTEPTPKNLMHLEKAIPQFKADIGFAQDPDADRLVLIDEKGRVLSEELTLALAVEAVLSKTPKGGDVVINMSTSMLTEAIAEKHGCKCYRTKVGEANVVEGIVRHKALIGGEGNGGVIYPEINTARDSLVGIGLVLELMASRKQKLSEIVDTFPKFTMIKEKFDFQGDLNLLNQKIKTSFPKASLNELDGLRLDWEEDGKPLWVHIRASNTEPVVRVIGESESPQKLDSAISRIKQLLK